MELNDKTHFLKVGNIYSYNKLFNPYVKIYVPFSPVNYKPNSKVQIKFPVSYLTFTSSSCSEVEIIHATLINEVKFSWQ